MQLKSLFAAVALSLFAKTGTTAEPPTPKTIEERVDQLTEDLEDTREDRLNLSLQYGYSYADEKIFTGKGASLGIDGYLVAIRLRQENEPYREEPDELKVAGFTLRGTRRYRMYHADVSFGYAFWQPYWRYVDVKIYGQVTGGIQLDTNYIKIEGEKIPGNLDLDFLVGGGSRIETAFRIPERWTYVPLSLGLGGVSEYLSSQVNVIDEKETAFHWSWYAFLRISRNRE